MDKRVLIIQRRLPQYRVPLFESLRARLAENDVTLQVVYGTPGYKDLLKGDEGILPWGMKIPCHYINLGSLQLVLQRIQKDVIEKQTLVILSHENRLVFNYLMLWRRNRNENRLAFFGHGANFQELQNNNYRRRWRAWTARHVDWWFAYSALSVEKVIESGFPKGRISCLNNSLDTKKLVKWRRSISDDELGALRLALDLKGKRVGVFLGALHKDKRLDFLFSASDKLHRAMEDFELLIVGDGPLRDRVKLYALNRPWVRWVGAKHDREKVMHLALGHVMLNPGMVGLGILDSFACGLPLVTTDCKIHSPEIAYLDPGRNGIITENRVETFTEEARRLFVNPSLRQKIAEEGMKDSSQYLLENMVQRFREGIMQALEATRFFPQ